MSMEMSLESVLFTLLAAVFESLAPVPHLQTTYETEVAGFKGQIPIQTVEGSTSCTVECFDRLALDFLLFVGTDVSRGSMEQL